MPVRRPKIPAVDAPGALLVGILDADLLLVWMEPPSTVSDELDQEGVTARPLGHHGESLVTHRSPEQLNRLLNGSSHVLIAHPAEVVAVSSTEEGEHLIVYDVAHRRGEAGADKCQLSALPKGVLDSGGQLAKLANLLVVTPCRG